MTSLSLNPVYLLNTSTWLGVQTPHLSTCMEIPEQQQRNVGKKSRLPCLGTAKARKKSMAWTREVTATSLVRSLLEKVCLAQDLEIM